MRRRALKTVLAIGLALIALVAVFFYVPVAPFIALCKNKQLVDGVYRPFSSVSGPYREGFVDGLEVALYWDGRHRNFQAAFLVPLEKALGLSRAEYLRLDDLVLVTPYAWISGAGTRGSSMIVWRDFWQGTSISRYGLTSSALRTMARDMSPAERAALGIDLETLKYRPSHYTDCRRLPALIQDLER